jgi:hypothetical protein
MATPAPFPDINGNKFAWSSVDLRADGNRYLGVKSLNYSQELAPGEVYGTHAQKIGRTRGELKPDGALEMFKQDADAMLNAFGNGYMEHSFDVYAAYREGTTISTVVLHGCRIKKVDDSHSQGTDALTTKLDLDVMWIERNNQAPLVAMLNPNV